MTHLRAHHGEIFREECACLAVLAGKPVHKCRHCGLGFHQAAHEASCASGVVNGADDNQRNIDQVEQGGDDVGINGNYDDLLPTIEAMLRILTEAVEDMPMEQILAPMGRVFNFIPGKRGAKKKFARLLEAALQQRNLAAKPGSDYDERVEEALLMLIFLIPAIYLERSQEVTSKVKQKEEIVLRLADPVKATKTFCERLKRRWDLLGRDQGHEPPVLHDGIANGAGTGVHEASVGFDAAAAAELMEKENAIRYIEALVKLGELGKAANVLERSPHAVLETTADLIKKLEKLLPRAGPVYDGDAAAPQPAPPADSAAEAELPEGAFSLGEVFAKMKKARACGISGWVIEHLMGRLTDGKHLHAFLIDIANGRLPSGMKPYMMGARMVPLRKDNDGVRPVAVGELFVKMAAVGALSTVMDKVASFLAKEGQLGVATKGGLDFIIHSVTAVLKTDAKAVVALIDIANA